MKLGYTKIARSKILIGSELYFDLLNINYRKKYAFLEVEKLTLPYINFGRNETQRLTSLLESIIDRDGDIYEIMSQLYYDYCHGYDFLIYLGISYVTSGIEENIGIEGIRNNLLESYAKYKQEANALICSFKKGELIITDEFEYEDYRKEEKTIELDQTQIVFKNTLKDKVYNNIQLWLQKISSYWFH